tara:strand:- start:5660 stop:6460 length:801 start_codon:yes stop_codon:yes gene_type:complete
MTVFKPTNLENGVNSVEGFNDISSGEQDLYNEGYNLEIEHLPTGYKVKFPAYLENFSDAFTQQWNAEDVYGRMDPIAVYQNTRRAIAMSWNVPANSMAQAKRNMDLINVLMSFNYPTYQKQGGNTTGAVLNMSPLVRVKFLNLIHNSKEENKGLLGYINGFTVDVRSENGMFMDNDIPAVYPKSVTLNFELNVLHEHMMGFTTGDEGKSVLRESKNGFPYRTDSPMPSTSQKAGTSVVLPPRNQRKENKTNGGKDQKALKDSKGRR